MKFDFPRRYAPVWDSKKKRPDAFCDIKNDFFIAVIIKYFLSSTRVKSKYCKGLDWCGACMCSKLELHDECGSLIICKTLGGRVRSFGEKEKRARRKLKEKVYTFNIFLYFFRLLFLQKNPYINLNIAHARTHCNIIDVSLQ